MARDQYKYFRIEARELLDGLSRGTLEAEKGAGGAEVVGRMMRLAHTLKGAARVVRQAEIADSAHAIEDVLAPHGKGGGPLPREDGARLLRLVDDISTKLATLEAPPSALAAPAPASAERVLASTPEPLTNVRVEIEEMDALLEGVFEVNVRLAALRAEIEHLTRARGLAGVLSELTPVGSRQRAVAEQLKETLTRATRGLHVGLDRADQEVAQVHERANQLRLMPASTVFALLERGVRDAAELLGKSVRFETTGGEHRLEAHVLLALRDALLHVVRNAVAHGIEAEGQRRAAGKPPAGTVRLDVERRGNRVAFVCRDDGRGIDADAVRRAAVGAGLVSESAAAALGSEEILRLVLRSGVTTAERVSEVSGRGIGLDVLRATAEELQGQVTIASEPGAGTTVDVCVPLSISSIATLVAQSNGVTIALPLDCVRKTLVLAATDVDRSAQGDTIRVDDAVVPLLPLSEVIAPAASPDPRPARAWPAVVLEWSGRRAALGVERLVGISTIVLRPLPRLAGPAPFAAGASLDVEGNPQLVLEPRGVVEAAHGARRGATATASASPRAPILVVDDSLTTRMLEQSILESAGYEVELATSAEDALRKARQAAYALFLVDVEMPGMNGFEFVSTTRADPNLGKVPAILVTSRDAPQDRRRGEEAGARAYIVKGEFDQGHLLRVIHQLIG